MISLKNNIKSQNIKSQQNKSNNIKSKNTVSLWPYQLYSVKKLLQLESNNNCFYKSYSYINSKFNFGIFNNKVGSGKSYCLLELCKYKCLNNYNININKDIIVRKHLIVNTNSYINNFFYCPINIICSPHNIIHQWKIYVENYNLNNDTIFITNQQSLNKFVDLLFLFYNNELNFTKSINPIFNNFNFINPIKLPKIVIIKNTFYNDLFNVIDSNIFLYFERLIIDEFLHIYNILNYIPANFIWLVSSSNLSIHDKSNPINLLVQYSSPYLLNHVTVRINDEFIDKFLNLQIPIIKICKYKLGNIQNIIRDSKINYLIDLVNAGLSVENLKNYFKCTNNVLDFIIKQLNDSKNKEGLSNYQLQIIDEKIINFKNKIKDSTCCICFESNCDDIISSICCKNIICFTCIYSFLKNKLLNCPMCRDPFENTIKIYRNSLGNNLPKSQYDVFISIINNINIKKNIIICVNNSKANIHIYNYLTDHLKLKCATLSGNEYVIKNKIDKYYKKEIDIIILTASYNGYGFNLQQTEYLIIFDYVSDSNINQVIGRCQRPGRTTQLQVFKLKNIYEN